MSTWGKVWNLYFNSCLVTNCGWRSAIEWDAYTAAGSWVQKRASTEHWPSCKSLTKLQFLPHRKQSAPIVQTSGFELCRTVISRVFENDTCMGGRGGGGGVTFCGQQADCLNVATADTVHCHRTPQITTHRKYTKHKCQHSQTPHFADTVHICNSNYAKNNQPFFPCTAWTVLCL
jgi:hypothetical protein